MSTSKPRAMAASRSWSPPTRIERDLHDAAKAGDRGRYLRVLAQADLFLYVPKDHKDASGGKPPWIPYADGRGNWCVVVRTAGERLPRRPQFTVVRTSLNELAHDWPGRRFSLHVNPGTPAAMLLTSGPWDVRRWKRTAKRHLLGDRPVSLLTKNTGHRTGPLAHALACGAHLSVRNGVLWNDLGDAYDDYERDAEILRDGWATTTAHAWQEQMDALLDGRNSPAEPEFALSVRRELSRATDTPLDADTWRRACSQVLDDLDERAIDEAVIQPLIGRILRYEARFRADGLLTPDGYVRSALAYDYGRAVSFARWGLGARLCSEATAEQAIRRAGALAREHHTSWADFSAGYALGRVMRFDTEEFGSWYTSVLEPHRLLMSEDDSPWLTLPWRQ
ncbi:DUF1266 domain-containing protein [Streptomyces triculaminicus]|uniref:DUF1266 domain-containing protein n=1 Tax=Streptomyces triculaminicus TaxID=2816232 RepID=UPI0037CD8887